MDNEKTISTLNELLEINNDRVEGYKTAIDETNDGDLKRIFTNLQETSAKNQTELRHEIMRAGGKPTEETKTSGKLFRAWMDFKAALTSQNRKTILNSCEQGEDVAVSAYQDVLEEEHIRDMNPEQVKLVNEQYRLIKAGHDLVKSLRNTAVSHS